MKETRQVKNIESVIIKDGYERVKSLNYNNCLTKNTKLLIVGTLTPPDGYKYFYTAPKNRIYGYIDAALDTKLKALKLQLYEDGSNDTVGKIKNVLKENGIAFLDVVKEAVRKNNSCLDSDISYFCLDYDSFEQIADYKSIKVICNSRAAQKYYGLIRDELANRGKQLPECEFCSQRFGKKEQWVEIIKTAVL